VRREDQKKRGTQLVSCLRLKATTDIAAELGKLKKPSQVLAGFALETSAGIREAKDKLETQRPRPN
jgi:phosphopantothenoylcysteine decarboxylase / phosphopantothenate---cysteine ligase